MFSSIPFDHLLWIWVVIAVAVFFLLLFISAPYGRHGRRGWGPQIGRAAGWVLMELPALAIFFAFYLLGDRRGNPTLIAFLVIWCAHYGHRVLIFPFRMRGGNKRMPLLIVAMGFFFNLVNGTIQGLHLFVLAPLASDWLLDPRFITGLLIFAAGYAINQHADAVLLGLRRTDEDGYRVPYGGLYRLISCPNYLGEIVEWLGWALLTWSPSGLVFAIWTIANLVPRAIAHHRWYRREFADYPAGRRAILPYLL